MHKHLTAQPQHSSQCGKEVRTYQAAWYFSTDVRCNTKYFRTWVWPPLAKKGADSFKWLPWAKQTKSSILSCPDLCIFQVFPEEQRAFAHHTHTDGPQHGKCVPACAQIQGKVYKYQGKKKIQENRFLAKIWKRKKKRQEVYLPSPPFCKICTILENTENQSHFECKTKGTRE